MGDLRLRAGDEVPEHVGRRVALAGSQRRERLEKVVLDDPFGSTELRKPTRGEVVGARVDRRAPDALEHELEEWRLDMLAVSFRLLARGGAAGR